MNLSVNGEPIEFDGDANMSLLRALRDVPGLTGTKFACGKGLGSARTVHLDGEAVRSCLTPVSAGDAA